MSPKYIVSGIQQVGIGVSNVYEAWEWYRKNLDMDLAVFDEAAEAGLMLPYTDGEARSRHAVLAMNHRGGSGLEIWQYTSRTPVGPDFKVRLGDLGINSIKYKTLDVQKSYNKLKKAGVKLFSEPNTTEGINTFFGEDPWGNLFELVEAKQWFKDTGEGNGGVYGTTIGVRDIDKSIPFYRDILGYDLIGYDKKGSFSDFDLVTGTKYQYRRVLLQHKALKKGPFANLLGPSELELVQVVNRTPKKIYEGRMWGDLGYIHLCYDIWGMDELKAKSYDAGHPFTVDSGASFDMGEAAGRFTYTEDPDGTLIEFVETHKLPIMKNIGWYYNLRNRDHEKALPKYLLKAMFLNRSKKPVWPK